MFGFVGDHLPAVCPRCRDTHGHSSGSGIGLERCQGDSSDWSALCLERSGHGLPLESSLTDLQGCKPCLLLSRHKTLQSEEPEIIEPFAKGHLDSDLFNVQPQGLPAWVGSDLQFGGPMRSACTLVSAWLQRVYPRPAPQKAALSTFRVRQDQIVAAACHKDCPRTHLRPGDPNAVWHLAKIGLPNVVLLRQTSVDPILD